jgi:hypothetical protein
MYCSRWQLVPNTAFCGDCGAPTSGAVTGPGVVKRPGIVTVLAVLQLLGATLWLLGALGMIAAGIMGSGQTEAGSVLVGLLLAALGVA